MHAAKWFTLSLLQSPPTSWMLHHLIPECYMTWYAQIEPQDGAFIGHEAMWGLLSKQSILPLWKSRLSLINSNWTENKRAWISATCISSSPTCWESKNSFGQFPSRLTLHVSNTCTFSFNCSRTTFERVAMGDSIENGRHSKWEHCLFVCLFVWATIVASAEGKSQKLGWGPILVHHSCPS